MKPIETSVKEINRRDFAKLATVTAAVLGGLPRAAFAATGNPEAALASTAQEGRGGELVVARFADSDSLDPHHSIAGVSSQVISNILETLVITNLDRELEGLLAESWEISEDGLEYTFHLRQSITFHDGSAFDADAVKFTFDRMIDPATAAPARGYVAALSEIVVVDPSTVKLILSEPFSPLLGHLSTPSLSILPPGAVQELGDDFGTSPVGTGPWKLDEWVQGESISLVPNEQYHNVKTYVENRGAPLLDKLVFRNIPEAETQTAAFETGEVNVIWPSPRELSRFKADSDYEVFVATYGIDLWYLEFSTEPLPEGESGAKFKAPFDDPAVRQAVAYGVNVDEIISNVLEGLAVRNYGLMPTGLWAFDPSIEQSGYHFDPEQAQAILEQAGWVDSDGDGVREKDGKTLEVLFWAWTEGANEKVVQVIQNQLNLIGFNVKTEVIEVGTLIARLPENVSDFNLMAYGIAEPDVVRLMNTTGWGFGNYADAEYRAAVTGALETTDRAERSALYLEASKRVLADAALVPLWSSLKATAVRSEVNGYKTDASNPDWGVYDDVYIEN